MLCTQYNKISLRASEINTFIPFVLSTLAVPHVQYWSAVFYQKEMHNIHADNCMSFCPEGEIYGLVTVRYCLMYISTGIPYSALSNDIPQI